MITSRKIVRWSELLRMVQRPNVFARWGGLLRMRHRNRIVGARPSGRTTLIVVALLALLSAQTEATAREIHYGAVGDAEIVACDQLHWRGQIEDSEDDKADSQQRRNGK